MNAGKVDLFAAFEGPDEAFEALDALITERDLLLTALHASPCYCEDADGDDDAITCDRCAALIKAQP